MNRSRSFPLLLAAVLWLAAESAVQAHESRPAYLEINETAAGRYDVLWRTPVLSGARLPVVLRFPESCRNVVEPMEKVLNDSVIERRVIDAGAAGLTGQRIEFVGLQASITDVLVRVSRRDGAPSTTLVRPARPWIEIAAVPGAFAVAGAFLVHGVQHILLGFDQLKNIPRVYTPADTAIQTPNSDTPYSFIGMDLRAEPMVLTVPPIEKERYFSIQLIDAYTFDFDYIGSRTTGNEGGSYLVAGPNWKGETPKGVKKVFRAETEFVLGVYRTQLFNPADLDNVKKVQAGYKAQTLSAFLGTAAPKAAPVIDFIKPLSPAEEKTSPQFFNILNFVLQFCPTHPSETELMARFAKIGVGAGKTVDVSKPEMKAAIEHGVADAWANFGGLVKQIDAGKVTSGDIFGTREYLKNNYLYRMAAAVLGIYGNSKLEAMYPVYAVDETKEKLNGANRYIVRFAPGKLPPVHAFWSLTMYEMPKSLLVANPIDRYLINSPMLPELKRDADGAVTLLIQNESPGKDKEANWLPAPKGPFMMAMRLYWPKEEAVEGKWTAPPAQEVKK